MIGLPKRAVLSRFSIICFLVLFSLSVLCASAKSGAGEPTDTTYHDYINNKISVKIHPWRDGRRNIELYNLYGALTYIHEDQHTAYSDSCQLQFYSNGAVERIGYSIHSDDGRLRVEIYFDSTNEPLRLKRNMQPWIKYAAAIETQYFWHRTERRWQQPEVIMCQPVPETHRSETAK